MRTNFFQSLQYLHSAGAWTLNISFAPDGIMVVSVLLNDTTAKSENPFPPMVLKGTAVELDEGFLDAISSPVKETAIFFQNRTTYQQEVEAASAKLAATAKTEKSEKLEKKQSTKIESEALMDNVQAVHSVKFEEVLIEVGKLNAACKYAEALEMLPDNEQYPDKSSELDRMRKELNWKIGQLALL